MRKERSPAPIAAYRRFLAKVSRRFARVAARHAESVSCRRGCFGCCVGLFQVSALDAAVAAEGLAALPDARREAIRRRGEAIARRLRPVFPGDPQTLSLDLARESEWDGFFEKTAAIACPFLVADDEGETATAAARSRASRWPQGFVCAIYAHRPHACRTFGLPLADRGKIVSDPCLLNFRGSGEETLRGAALPLYEPEEERIARDAESRRGLPVESATILPAVAAGRLPSPGGPGLSRPRRT